MARMGRRSWTGRRTSSRAPTDGSRSSAAPIPVGSRWRRGPARPRLARKSYRRRVRGAQPGEPRVVHAEWPVADRVLELRRARRPALGELAGRGCDSSTGFRHELQAGGDAAYDRTFWRDRQPLRWAENVVASGIPVLLWAGWGDIVEEGAVRLYSALQNAHAGRPLFGPMTAGQSTTPRYQLIMGDWPHGAGLDAGIFLQWLETWVKGVDTGIQNTPTPMHLFEPGTGRWINVAGYPAVPELHVLAPR